MSNSRVFPGKPADLKARLVSTIAGHLAARASLSPEDLMIILHEVPRENWSFSRGKLFLAPALASAVPV